MKHSLRITAVATLVAASAFVLPTAAQADPIYGPENACSVSPATVAAGGTVEFSCVEGTFGPTEAVNITVEGATSVQFGFIKFAVPTSTTSTSTGDGALAPLSITFPTDASGVYNISAVSATSAGGVATASISSTAGGGTAPGSGSGSESGGSLPATGLDSSSLLGLWVGGGALVLAGGAVAVATAVRRNRKEHAGV